MSLVSLKHFTIKSFHEGLVAKKFSAIEATREIFNHIKETDKNIGAYLSLNEEGALKTAERVDEAIVQGEKVGALAGAPLAIKDNILIKALPATAGSKSLENYIASYSAGVVQKLKKELAIFLGKTNLDEFAMGSSTENSGFHLTHNPRNPELVPGGSSGGSAAAVASDQALAALGSDTGGSIRQPAAFCGVVGLKTTYGSVSRSGLIAMASSLDQIGPITKTVEDAAILFRAIAGKDEYDATSVDFDYGEELTNPKIEKVRALKIGVPDEYFPKELDEKVGEKVEEAIKDIEGMKIIFKKISLPHTRYALPCYYIIMPAEVSSNLARFDGIRYARLHTAEPRGKNPSILRDIYLKQKGDGFGTETKRRVILGTFVLSSGYYDAYYQKAQQVRTLVKQDFDRAFKEVDAILTPVTPTLPFRVGEKISDPYQMYLSDIFTVPANLVGLPAISIPVNDWDKDEGALPVGFQLIGRHFREADIMGIGQYYEKLKG